MDARPEGRVPTPSDDEDSAWERALLDRQLAALDRLAEMGMRIAAAIEQQVTEAAPEPDAKPTAALHHAAIDFARVARAVRRGRVLGAARRRVELV